MKLTLQTQLLPERDHAVRLKKTVERFNEAANWLAGLAFERKVSNKLVLQRLAYRELRDRFALPADMAVRCLAQVCEAYKRDKTIRPKFRPQAAVPYSMGKNISFKGPDRVSISTLSGRVIVPFVMGAYQTEKFGFAKGQSDLVLRGDGQWFLLVTVDVPDGAPVPTTDFIGIDLGVENSAGDSDGEIHASKDIESERKESRYRRAVNHVISKRIVAKAKDTGRGIAARDLSGLRDRTQFRQPQRFRLGGWSFFQLRSFLASKAALTGIPLVTVDPRNTSRTCAECGHCEQANRKSQAEFSCRSCGPTAHADLNAARNIRARASVPAPQGSERQFAGSSRSKLAPSGASR